MLNKLGTEDHSMDCLLTKNDCCTVGTPNTLAKCLKYILLRLIYDDGLIIPKANLHDYILI